MLVHGGWSGADIWRHLRRRLQVSGPELVTPSLTGLGERIHLASPQVTVSTHVSDVTNLVLYEDISDVLLVGFSYGGFVVTGALRLIGESSPSQPLYLGQPLAARPRPSTGIGLGLQHQLAQRPRPDPELGPSA